MEKSELEDRIQYLNEYLPQFAKNLAVVASIGAAIAVQLLLGALQLHPSSWKTISVLSCIISSLLFLSGAIIYCYTYPEQKLPKKSPNFLVTIAAAFTVWSIFFGFLAFFIGLTSFVGAENPLYAKIGVPFGLFPLALFLYLLMEVEMEWRRRGK